MPRSKGCQTRCFGWAAAFNCTLGLVALFLHQKIQNPQGSGWSISFIIRPHHLSHEPKASASHTELNGKSYTVCAIEDLSRSLLPKTEYMKELIMLKSPLKATHWFEGTGNGDVVVALSFTWTPTTDLINTILGWKKSLEKLNAQMTCEFMFISLLLGGQFWPSLLLGGQFWPSTICSQVFFPNKLKVS